MPHHKVSLNSGQSLVELIVGIAIIAMVLLSISALATKSVQMAEVANLRQRAVTLAREGIEKMRTTRDSSAWPDFVEAYTLSPVSDTIDSRFTRQYSLVDNGNGTANAVVEVLWRDSKGNHRVTQETIFSNWK